MQKHSHVVRVQANWAAPSADKRGRQRVDRPVVSTRNYSTFMAVATIELRNFYEEQRQ